MKPFWDAAKQRRLTVQHSTDCGQRYFYPRPFCLQCADPRQPYSD